MTTAEVKMGDEHVDRVPMVLQLATKAKRVPGESSVEMAKGEIQTLNPRSVDRA